MARAEKLAAHANAVSIRINKEKMINISKLVRRTFLT